jgi:hypothetical protein
MTPFIMKSNSLSLFPAGAPPIIIDSGHVSFNAVVEAIKDNDFDLAIELASVTNFINSVSGGNVNVNDDGVFFKGEKITGYLANKLTQFFQQGLPVAQYCLFLSNLMDNPSMVSRNELFLFLEAADLPITEDGCFLAYKAVRHDFKDKHSGKFDNSPGITHSMPRASVDDDRNRTCSYGFHAAAYEYAKGFLGGTGDKMVAVKINPRDVVSVPSDYNNQKLRTCLYKVMFEIPGAFDMFKGKSYYDTSGTATFDRGTNSYFWGNVFDEYED